MMQRDISKHRRGGVVARRLPYRAGMICSAMGLGVLLIGLAAKGALQFDGSAQITAPDFWPDWLVKGGLRIVADGEFSDPRLLFASVGVTLLLIGAVQIINDLMHRDLFD